MKFINDSFGHSEGDRALVETAKILKHSYREADVIARMGGDEFATIAMEYGENWDENLHSRLQKNLDDYNKKSSLDYKLSMSVGIVHFDHNQNRTIDELISKADTLMYEHKKSKNRNSSS